MLGQGPALGGLCQPGQHLPKPKGEGELALPHPHKLPGLHPYPEATGVNGDGGSLLGMQGRWQRQDTEATGSHLSSPTISRDVHIQDGALQHSSHTRAGG